MVALRASCVTALAIQDVLSQLAGEEATPNLPFIAPLYTFLLNVNEDNTQPTPTGDQMWEFLLREGPLVNLTVLAKAVRSRKGSPLASFSFCLRAFDILLAQLGIPPTKISESTLSLFNEERKLTRKDMQDEKWGFRITPLLETLDAVARGLRLSEAFSSYPEYHSRADLVFRKGKIWNSDLLAAFARCLPKYVAKIAPEKCTEYMEGIVRDNDLWTNLQVKLWNSRQSGGPTHDKFRIFKDCCTVLDVAFTALEHSSKVDWGAPEFGSLAQHFQLFTAHCFQGAFMGKPTTFRLGIIKARFCKAVLAQFQKDVDREGTTFFRPQWDIAALAKLLCSFGIGDSKDVVFWESYISGGSIGVESTTRARELLYKALRDGPLVIFCQLGRLATMAAVAELPDRSGLEAAREDIAKVWNIILNDHRLPLDRASDTVWDELDQLQDQVSRLRHTNSGRDGDNLQHLLGAIEEVRTRRSVVLLTPAVN